MSHVTNNRLLIDEKAIELNRFVNILLQQLFQLEQLTANNILCVLAENAFLIKEKFANGHEYTVTIIKLTDYLLTFLNGRKNVSEWCYVEEGMLYRSTEEEIELECYHCEHLEKHDFVRFKQLCSRLERQYANKNIRLTVFNVLTGSRYSIRTSKQCC